MGIYFFKLGEYTWLRSPCVFTIHIQSIITIVGVHVFLIVYGDYLRVRVYSKLVENAFRKDLAFPA